MNLQRIWILFIWLGCSMVYGSVIMCYTKTDNPRPELIDPFMCTHLLVINNCTLSENGILLPDESVMRRYNKLKTVNPELKVLVSLTPQNTLMSAITTNPSQIEQVSQTIKSYMIRNQLDGFDIDWEFPAWSGDSRPTDRQGLVDILKKLRETFDGQTERRLLLTVAVAALFNIVDNSYDVPALNQYCDYVQIMNYDFHMFSGVRPFTGFNAPLRAEPYEILFLDRINSEYSTNNWLNKGISKEKLVFGIPVYGYGFELLTKYMHFPYAPAVGYSKLGGTMPYRRSCKYAQTPGFTYVYDKHAASPYLYNEREWLSIEDKRSVGEKTQFAKDLGVAGVMVFALDSDDYQGKCGEGTYPLTKHIHSVMTSTVQEHPVDVMRREEVVLIKQEVPTADKKVPNLLDPFGVDGFRV